MSEEVGERRIKVRIAGKKRPGLKPGQRHSGQFKSVDPRRCTTGPRTKAVTREFKQKIRDLEDGALSLLEDCIADTNAPYRERRAAAELVLAHSQGLPVSRVLMAEVDNAGGLLDTLGMDDIHQRLRLIHQQKELEVHTYEEN